MESKVALENRRRTGNQGQCPPMPSPNYGTYKLVAGNGTSVGTVMTLVCPLMHHPISGGRISCVQENNVTEWSGGVPECKSNVYDGQSLHLALLLSIISVAIIMVMGIIFITACLLNCVKKEEMRQHKRERIREAARFWNQLNPEEQAEYFFNQNHQISSSNNNNNNNNNNNSKNTGKSRQKQYPRCHQNFPDPQIMNHLQSTLGQMPPSLSCV